MKQFQEQYDELMNRVKKQITSSIKPASFLPKMGGIGGKQKDDEEVKDTPPAHGSGSTTNRPSTIGLKRPGA